MWLTTVGTRQGKLIFLKKLIAFLREKAVQKLIPKKKKSKPQTQSPYLFDFVYLFQA